MARRVNFAEVCDPSNPALPAPSSFDLGYVDLLHRQHRLEGTLGLPTAGSHRISEHARRDLPGQSPAIPTPATRTLFAAVPDDGVPVAVGFVLVVRGDLKGECLAVLKLRTTVEAEAGD